MHIPVQDRVVNQSQKWTAEIKLLILFCYFFVLLAVSQTALTFALRNQPKFLVELAGYFICEAKGILGSSCERSFERLAFDIPIAIGYGLLGLYPIVSLIYVVSVEELIESCRGKKKKNSVSLSGNSRHSSSTLALKGRMSVNSKANSNLSLEHNV